MSGEEVEKYYRDGHIREIAEYCESDVVNPRVNPLIRTASRAASDMVRYASEFGLTPVARARLAAGPFGQPPGGGKFDGLLAGG